MLITITVLIAVKVVTGTLVNRQRKKAGGLQELLEARDRLEHCNQRHQAAED